MRENSLRHPLPAILILAVILALLFAAIAASSAPPKNLLNDPVALRESLVREIHLVGGEFAFDSFKKRYGSVPQERRHFGAHIFGEALYRAQGTKGIAACDSDLEFGCFHGFFIGAVSDQGTDVVEQLDATCVTLYGPLGTGCQHGIGHGILEFVGSSDLSDALRICAEQTTWPAPLLGCHSGVFMEYFFPLSDSRGGFISEVRPFDASQPFMPCTDVPHEFRDPCYYELGQWVGHAAPEVDICSKLSGSERRHCFLGYGGFVARPNYSVETVKAACATLDVADETACRAGAAWAFFSTDKHRERAGELCVFTEARRTEECRALGDFTRGKDPSFSKNRL